MSEQDTQFLEAFGSWLESLGGDAGALADVLSNADLPEETRRPVGGALNYLFKSLDLIDDGIEGLGFLDDAFVLRVAAAQAAGGPGGEALAQLAAEAALVEAFLGADYARLTRFVDGLASSTVRGRSVDAILSEGAVCEELVGDLRGWARRYEAPQFARDPKQLVKLRAFLGAKLPV
jgi:uncharacterized membrane protein YkvA (DUF1232 family)